MKRIFCSLLLLACLLPAGCGGGGSNPPPPPPPPPQPSVAITAPAAGSTVSGTVTLQASCSNCPANSQIQFKDGTGNIGSPAAVAAGVASVSWNTLPVGNGAHTLTAELVGTTVKSSPVSVTVNNVQSQLPRIDSVFPADGTPTTPPEIFCPSPLECLSFSWAPHKVLGANFTAPPNGNRIVTGVKSGLWLWVSPTELSISYIIDSTSYNPGAVSEEYPTQAGPSNKAWVPFWGLFNTLKLSATGNEAFLYDQGNWKIRVFDRTTKTQIREFSSLADTRDFAVDNQTGLVLVTSGTGAGGVIAFKPDGTRFGGADNGKLARAVAARDGRICVSQDADGLLTTADLSGLPVLRPLESINIGGGKPFPVAITKVGTALACATVDVEGNRIIEVDPVAKTKTAEALINGVRKASQLPPARGGWLLEPLDAKALWAYLHVADRKLKFFTYGSLTETREVDLSNRSEGLPARIVADESTGTLLVVMFDPKTGLSSLLRIDPATGNINALPRTESFLGTGVGVDAAGRIFLANRLAFR